MTAMTAKYSTLPTRELAGDGRWTGSGAAARISFNSCYGVSITVHLFKSLTACHIVPIFRQIPVPSDHARVRLGQAGPICCACRCMQSISLTHAPE